jgi:hypothetical protein
LGILLRGVVHFAGSSLPLMMGLSFFGSRKRRRKKTLEKIRIPEKAMKADLGLLNKQNN